MKRIILISRISLIAATAALLSSCTSFKPERDNVIAEQTPEQFVGTSGTEQIATEWWKSFNSEQLNKLISDAFSGNLTLEQAAARLEQAEAVARKSGAAGKLQLDLRDNNAIRYSSEGSSATVESYDRGLYASYEIDLWGRLNSIENAAMADWEASKFDVQTAAMSLSAELATSYFTWLTQSKALSIYESQLQSSQNKLIAIQRRYQTGQSTALALLQQRQQVAAAEAKLPPVHALVATSENKIAVLTGKIPGTNLRLAPESLPSLPAQPATGLPVALLENRPDIQAARLALESADWSVGAARAARLPTLSLTGSVVTSSDSISDLFDDWIANLATSMIAPLLDGGSRKAEVARTRAVSREKIAAYRLAVLEAIQETEDALSNEAHQTDFLDALYKQFAAAQKSESESIRRYQRGLLPYLDTLTAIVARETLEINCLLAKADLLADRIQLYRSLGGDWTFILETK